MRDFRDAKAMAHSLREALAAKKLKVTNSESLELISRAFGVIDWNTLSAVIQGERTAPSEASSATPPERPSWPTTAPNSSELAATLQRAVGDAVQRGHHFVTLEHVLLALIDDPQGADVLASCSVDCSALRASLTEYVEKDLQPLADLAKLRNNLPPHLDRNVLTDRAASPAPTAGLVRASEVAQRRVALAGRPAVTGADLLLAVFLNAGDCTGATLLEKHGMSRRSALVALSPSPPASGGSAAA